MGETIMTNGVNAVRRHWRRTNTSRRGRHTALRAAAVVLLAFLAALGASSTAGAADGDGLIKVFVVKDPAQSGGQGDSLQSVAASTLGDPARAGEIFDLNRGRAQPDGSALNDPGDVLRPGWILALPDDASGPDVQQARQTGGTSASAPPPAAAAGTAQRSDDDTVAIPLPAVLAGVGAVLLALVTAGIVARRRVRRFFSAVGRWVRKLGDPARRRRRLQFRRSVATRFAADAESVRRAYGTLEEFAAQHGEPETPVHALRVDQSGVTAWLTAADTLGTPWEHVDDTRWRRPAGATAWLMRGTGGGPSPKARPASACLVRVGTDSEAEPVFVDLSRLDGVLSVTGDHRVARDVVRGLLAEVARSRPDVPVTVLRGTDGGPPIPLPQELTEMTRVDESLRAPRTVSSQGTVRAAASRRPVKGLVIMSGAPTGREAAELSALCGPGGAGWTGLVCGEVGGAHWRWQTDSEGRVDIPVLGLKLTVPA